MKQAKPKKATAVIWCACLVSLFVTVQRVSAFEGTIGAALDATRAFNERIAANEVIIAKSNRLHEEERRAWHDLSPLSTGPNAADSFAQFVRNIADLAVKLRVRIISTNASAEMTAAKPGTGRYLLPSNVTMLVKGRFASIVRFVQEVTRQQPVAEIGVPRIAADPQPSSKGVVESTIRLTLYRLLLDAAASRHV